MSAKLIFSDIDGTLITSQGVVSSTTIEAIVSQIIGENSSFMQAEVKVPAIFANEVLESAYKIHRLKSAVISGT